MGQTFFRIGLLTTVFGGFLFLSEFGVAKSIGLLLLLFGYLFGVMALLGDDSAEDTNGT